ncbi:MAG: tetratricopeptide repeat protein [Chitinophagales bacterium]|nr:tetratricopeptide repeat protein [Chitinophagales bacterium]
MKRLPVIIGILICCLSVFAQPGGRGGAIQLIADGDNFLRQGVFDRALQAYASAIARDPTYAQAYMKRASLNAKLSNNREAIEDYNKAIALNPYVEYI